MRSAGELRAPHEIRCAFPYCHHPTVAAGWRIKCDSPTPVKTPHHTHTPVCRHRKRRFQRIFRRPCRNSPYAQERVRIQSGKRRNSANVSPRASSRAMMLRRLEWSETRPKSVVKPPTERPTCSCGKAAFTRSDTSPSMRNWYRVGKIGDISVPSLTKRPHSASSLTRGESFRVLCPQNTDRTIIEHRTDTRRR